MMRSVLLPVAAIASCPDIPKEVDILSGCYGRLPRPKQAKPNAGAWFQMLEADSNPGTDLKVHPETDLKVNVMGASNGGYWFDTLKADSNPKTDVKVNVMGASNGGYWFDTLKADSNPKTDLKVNVMGASNGGYWFDMLKADSNPKTDLKVNVMGASTNGGYWFDMVKADSNLETDLKVYPENFTNPETDLNVDVGGGWWPENFKAETDLKVYPENFTNPETDLNVDVGGGWWPENFKAETDLKVYPENFTNPETDLNVDVGGGWWPENFKAETDFKVNMEEAASSVFDWMNETLPPLYEVGRGKVRFFASDQEVEAYWTAQQLPGRKGVKTPDEFMNHSVHVLSVADIPWGDVFFTCHKIGFRVCHKPLRSQSFAVATVKFEDDGRIENIVFTEHKMDGFCKTNCAYMHHPIEYGLFRVPVDRVILI